MPSGRPDLLPFAQTVTLGLPYHGVVIGGDPTDPATPGTLALPSSATREMPQPADGGCFLVQHPKHAALPRTKAETDHDIAKDFQWLEYELLSGVRHQIGDEDLGADYHLYCDADYAWRIRIALTQGRGTCTLTVYLAGLFGLFGDADYSMTERQLATLTWTPTDANGTPMTDKYVGGRSLRTFSKDGAKVVMNVGTYFQAPGTSTLTGLYAFSCQHQTYSNAIYVHDIVRITISGTGSIAAGKIGTGISASIARTAAGRYTTTVYEEEVVPSVFAGYSNTNYTTTVTREGFYVIPPSGSETHYSMVSITTGSYVWTDVEYYEGGSTGKAQDVEWSAVQTATFGGNVYDGTASYVGDWAYLRNPNNQGTLTHNGSAEAWQSGTGAAVADAPDVFLPSTGIELPYVITMWPPGLDLVAWFADGKSQQEITEADQEKYWTYNPGSGAFTMSDNPVCYV